MQLSFYKIFFLLGYKSQKRMFFSLNYFIRIWLWVYKLTFKLLYFFKVPIFNFLLYSSLFIYNVSSVMHSFYSLLNSLHVLAYLLRCFPFQKWVYISDFNWWFVFLLLLCIWYFFDHYVEISNFLINAKGEKHEKNIFIVAWVQRTKKEA